MCSQSWSTLSINHQTHLEENAQMGELALVIFHISALNLSQGFPCSQCSVETVVPFACRVDPSWQPTCQRGYPALLAERFRR